MIVMANNVENQRNMVALGVLVLIVLLVAGVYYLASTKAPSHVTTPTGPSSAYSIGQNIKATHIDASSNPYAITPSYINNSSLTYVQEVSLTGNPPAYNGPGVLGYYDSLVSNATFFNLSKTPNGNLTTFLAGVPPNTLLNLWAIAEPTNSTAAASGVYSFLLNRSFRSTSSVVSVSTIANVSSLVTYLSQNTSIPLKTYTIIAVRNKTFVQIGASMPLNSSPETLVPILNSYLRNIPG